MKFALQKNDNAKLKLFILFLKYFK